MNIQQLLRISEKDALFDFGKIVFVHTKTGDSSSAFEIHERGKLEIYIPRSIGVINATVQFFNESESEKLTSIDAKWIKLDGKFDVYEIKLPIKCLGTGLYFFNLKITSVVGTIYGYKDKNRLLFSTKKDLYRNFQFSVSDFCYSEPKQYYGGIIYHIFVDRFYRAKNSRLEDGKIFVESWDSPLPEYPAYPGAPIKNNYFYGGTLWGIIEKLQYLQSLGVTVIYLSPIFKSPSNHKYDTSDYMKVDEDFGGEKALKCLIKRSRNFGISIILDGVFNHTGADSIYFNKYDRFNSIGAFQSKDSPYYAWYNFNSYPNDYTSWWGIEILPRINPEIPDCREYFIGNGGVVEKYSKLGISGLRLDVVDELSDSFTEGIKEKLNRHNENSLLYGEVWEDASNKIAYGVRKKYYLGKELDGVMNYPLRDGIISFLRDFNTEKLYYALSEVMFNAPKRIRDMQMNLIGTHDTERIITVLGGETSKGKTNEYLSKHRMTQSEYDIGKTKLLMAYTIIATVPGIPSIFYGDEAGLQGYGDPFNRLPFPWGKEDTDIIAHYKKIGNLRKKYSVYKTGNFKLNYLDNGVLIFSRYNSYNAYVTVVNVNASPITINFSERTYSILDSCFGNEFKINTRSSVFKTIKNAKINIKF